jgi:hypothetical protein
MDPDRLQRGEQVRVVTGPARLESTGDVWPCLSTAGCISVDGQRDESGRVGLVAVSGGGGEEGVGEDDQGVVQRCQEV